MEKSEQLMVLASIAMHGCWLSSGKVFESKALAKMSVEIAEEILREVEKKK